MKRVSSSPLLLACLAILCTTPMGARAAVTDTYSSKLSNWCELHYEFSANIITQIDLIASDKEAIAALLYQNYEASHDLAAELAKQPSGRSVSFDLPAESVKAANDFFTLGNLLDSNLQLKVHSARMFCSVSARARLQEQKQVDQSVRKQKIDRAISFIQDQNETVQRRGLAALMDVATEEQLLSLTADQRSKVIELAHAEALKSLADLDGHGLPRSDSFDFGAMSLLREVNDPRALDLYMMTIEKGHGSLQKSALRALGNMLPRPTQVLDRLASLIERNHIASEAKDEALKALFLIGRQGSRPFFERFARGQDEALAQISIGILDELNAQAVVSKPPKPKSGARAGSDDTVVLPKHKI